MAPLMCCVGGCNATSDSHRLFSVPKDDNLRALWMFFLVPTNPLLIGLTKDQLMRKRVCHKHFDRYQLDGQGRRTRYSYPCLFSAKEITYGIPLSSEEYHVRTEHNYGRMRQETQRETNINNLVAETRKPHHITGIEPKLGSEAQDYSPDFSTVEEFKSNTELLEKSPTTSVEYGPNINKDVAVHIALTGLDEETRKTLIKEHPIPNNCTIRHAPSSLLLLLLL